MGCQSFIDISNASIDLVNVSTERKVIDFARFTFPLTLNTDSLSKRVSDVTNSSEFNSHLMSKKPKFSSGETNTSLIPNALFSEAEFETISHLENYDSRKITSQVIANHETVGVFESKQLGTISNISNSFLSWIGQLDLTNQSPTIQLIVDERTTTIVLTSQGSIQLVNSFETKTENDILYYVLASLESREILHTNTSICLWGSISKGDKTHQKISQYFKSVSFGKLPSNLTYAYGISKIEAHRYPFIFAAVCE